VRKRGTLIATVTESRFMPPWHAVHGYGEFVDERRLTDTEIDSLIADLRNVRDFLQTEGDRVQPDARGDDGGPDGCLCAFSHGGILVHRSGVAFSAARRPRLPGRR